MNLKEKVVLIVGGAGYIGSVTALEFAKQGAHVAICDINKNALDEKVASIKEFDPKAKGYVIEVTDSSSVNEVINQVIKDFGRIDISIYAAGGSARIAGPNNYRPIIDQQDFVIEKVLTVNLFGAIFVARAVGKYMVENKIHGRIISFSSTVGVNGLKNCSDYAAAKAGVMGFTKSFAKELGEYGITVNCVAPGIVTRPDERNDEYAKKTNFLNEICNANDVAQLIMFVSSDEARFITGQTYIIDGGRSLAMKGTD